MTIRSSTEKLNFYFNMTQSGAFGIFKIQFLLSIWLDQLYSFFKSLNDGPDCPWTPRRVVKLVSSKFKSCHKRSTSLIKLGHTTVAPQSTLHSPFILKYWAGKSRQESWQGKPQLHSGGKDLSMTFANVNVVVAYRWKFCFGVRNQDQPSSRGPRFNSPTPHPIFSTTFSSSQFYSRK